MSTQQPEALRLADSLEGDAVSPIDLKAAAELRRLYAEAFELRLYKNLAAEFGLSIFPDLEEIQKRITELEQANAELLETNQRLLGVLRPFGAFVFSTKWIGHQYVENQGDSCVLCGYDDNGQTTGVDVNYSDFTKAREAIAKNGDAS